MSPRRMYHWMRNSLALGVLGVTSMGAGPSSCSRPMYLYLTYPGDPATSITVNYQTVKPSKTTMVYYDTVSRQGHVDQYAFYTNGARKQIPGLPVERTIHYATLTGLEPGATYYFVAGDAAAGFSEERAFRTIPDGDEPIRFVAGGDMGVSPLTKRLLVMAGKQDPCFAVVGGDIAYANGELKNYRDWDKWFENWDTFMRAPDGRMIPMLVAIGNHEVNDSQSPDPAVRAPFYFGYFGQQAGGTYFDRPFGANIAFIALDSGHIAPHDGEQAAWLRETLARNESVPFKFAVYHVPLYPSHRPYEGENSAQDRTHWAPLFDEFHLTAAFENHDHTLKRTKPLRNNEVSDEGTLYLGDGSWGVVPRDVDAERRWYEAFAASAGHVWVVDVTRDGVTYRALNEHGKVLDRCATPAVAGAAR